MNLIKERESLDKEVSQSFANKKILNKECYLISKTHIYSLQLNQIKDIMNKHPGKNENEMINILKQNFPNEDKIELDLNKSLTDLRDSHIYNSKLYYPKNYQKKEIFYFKNSEIISSQFKNQLDAIDKNFGKHCLKIPCVFDMNKIITLLNDKIINIANYNGNEIIAEYIIKSDKPANLFEIIKQKGYNFISQYISYDKVAIPINHNHHKYDINASIYKLTPDGNIETRISDKLKTLIFLVISQYYNIYNTPQKVYLINPKWLKQFNYSKIIKQIHEKINNPSHLNLTDLNSISSIIPYLDIKKLKEIDNEIMTNPNSSIQFESSAEQIAILNKYFLIYTNFIIANQQCFEYLKNNFGIKINPADIYYLNKKNEGDFIILKNYPTYLQQSQDKIENLIIVGEIDRTKNIFGIKYICEYFNANILEKELEDITKTNFKDYLNKRVCFSDKIPNDYISPIFVNNQRVGAFYLYKKDFDYKRCYYYSNYLYNKPLMISVYLFANKFNLYSRLRTQTPIDEEFYLINQKIILDIKTKNHYEQYKKYFINNCHVNYIGDIEKYLLIKNIPKDDLKNLYNIQKKESNNIHQTNIQLNQSNIKYEIDIIPIQNPSNSSEIFYIGNDFDLIENNCAPFLFKDINEKPHSKILCSFVGNNKIIFHYPINKFNNNKYNICVLSKYVESKKFVNEYLIKYNSQNAYQMHINQIKNNINDFITNLQFNKNNIAKIVKPGFTEIGIVIKITEFAPTNMQGQTAPFPNQISTNNLPPQPHTSSVPVPMPAPSAKKIISNPVQPVIPPVPEKRDKMTTRKYFDSKPLIGLENIGATCYMNATLQCMCNIEKFVDYFFEPHPLIEKVKQEETQNLKLCTSFKELIDNLFPKYSNNEKKSFEVKNPKINIINNGNKKEIKGYYAPREFKDKISKMNPLFEGIQANDAKDLVNFLIMTLHLELNKAPKDQNEEIVGNIFEDQRNKLLMFQNFSKNFIKTHQSIISDLFYALNYNMSTCLNCGAKTYNYQIYFFLIFPLEEVRKYKLSKNNGISNFNNFNFGNFNNNFVNNMNNNNFGNFNFVNNFNFNNNFQNNFNNNFPLVNNNNNNFANNFPFNFNNNNFINNMNTSPNNNNKPNEVDIMDCFEFDQKVNIMSGTNAMYCNYCKQTCSSSMSTLLATGPEILIIILNRGKGNEFNVKLNFKNDLNLQKYIERQETGYLYELIGVITHIGESSMSGHFIAYCKEYFENTWLKFNDAMVDPVKNFQSEVIDFATPYLLFYKKIKKS